MKYVSIALALLQTLFLSLLLGSVCDASGQALVVRVATREGVAPMVMPDHRSGLELDIVREAFRLEGYSIEPVILPPLRVLDVLLTGKVDAAFPFNSHKRGALYYSDSYFMLRNIAVSLKELKATINSPADLKQYSVVAFQGASLWLPKDFRDMAAANINYAEQTDQKGQVRSFFVRRDRVIVLDQLVFRYYAAMRDVNPDHLEFVEHVILPSSPVSVAFTNAELRDVFNNGLRRLRKSGGYDAILHRYIDTLP